MSVYGFTVTTKGRALLAKLIAGDRLPITRVMIGGGKVPEGTNPADLEDLVSPIVEATATSPTVDGTNVSFVVEYRSDLNGGLEQDIYINEFGVFATDQEEGEILLYYASLGDYPEPVPAYQAGGPVISRRYPVVLTVADGVEVTLNFESGAYVTLEDVKEYIEVTALPEFLERAQELIEAHNQAPDAHPDIRNEISQMGARVGRLEDMMLNDVTGNPYIITFDTLEGLVVGGVWNKAQQRIEF